METTAVEVIQLVDLKASATLQGMEEIVRVWKQSYPQFELEDLVRGYDGDEWLITATLRCVSR